MIGWVGKKIFVFSKEDFGKPRTGTMTEQLTKQSSNFILSQQAYRETLRHFFSDEDNFLRLIRITLGPPKICSVIFYFVKEYKSHRFIQFNGEVLRLSDEYSNAITSHKKRYYNFESRIGHGELLWEGEKNPIVPIRGIDKFPLPTLVALKWFIQFNFDRLFWKEFDEVQQSFTEFTTTIKRKYTETHKQKKRSHREEIVKRVISGRSAHTHAPPGKPSQLTPNERNLVRSILKEETTKQKKIKKIIRASGKRPPGATISRGKKVQRAKDLGCTVTVECTNKLIV